MGIQDTFIKYVFRFFDPFCVRLQKVLKTPKYFHYGYQKTQSLMPISNPFTQRILRFFDTSIKML
jgi:hypothetical protein